MGAPKDPKKRAEWIENIRAAMKGKNTYPRTPEHGKRISKSLEGHICSKETKGKISKSLRKSRKVIICARLGCHNTREVLVDSIIKYCCNKCYWIDMKGHPTWNKGLTKETDERIGTGPKKISPETRKKMGIMSSERLRKLWQDPEFVAKQMRARNICPNKAEKFLDKLFQRLFPNQIKYTGDGKDKDCIIAGKCPDFIYVTQKKIIELFGEPFHEPEEEQERIDLFAQYGYQTLIIWYQELKNISLVTQKILEFTGCNV